MLAPNSEAELAAAIRKAYEDKTPLRIRGGGTRADLGRPAQPAEVLSTAGLSGITLYDPGALTMIAQAGTPMAEIEAALEAENQMLAFEPMDHRGLLGSAGEPRFTPPPAPKHPRTAFPKAGNNGRHGCIEPCRVVGFQDCDSFGPVGQQQSLSVSQGGTKQESRGQARESRTIGSNSVGFWHLRVVY